MQNGQLTSKGKELYSAAANSWRMVSGTEPACAEREAGGEHAAHLQRRRAQRTGRRGPGAADRGRRTPRKRLAVRCAGGRAYKAKNTGVGDLASTKAVALAPAAQRVRLKDELNRLKEHPNGTEQTEDV